MSSSPLKPHRGTTILVLGIVSLFCCGIILGPVTWIMANADLKEMDAGVMDPAGRGTTQAGKIVAIIGLVLFVIGILAQIALVALQVSMMPQQG